MIDFEAFHRSCLLPYSAENNCFTAATAAFPRAYFFAEWWRALSCEGRAALLASRDISGVVENLARAGGCAECPTVARGREFGITRVGLSIPPAICVGTPAGWFARGHRAAVRLPQPYIRKAWSLTDG